jgi:diguanylate cyclase (GGDEF)-like protein
MAPPLLARERMRVFNRGDGLLVAGLIACAAVMFGQPLRRVLSLAEELSRSQGIDLVPGLVILVLVFTVHQRQKQRDTAGAMALASRDAEEARRTAQEMKQLVDASHALSNALDQSQLRIEAWRHVPGLTGGRPTWVAVTALHTSQWIMEPDGECERHTLELVPTLMALTEAGERCHNGWALFQLRSSGRPFGVLAVQDTPALSAVDESRIETLAAILSIAAKNVQLFAEMQMTSVSDGLTGCFNRAHAFATLDSEIRRAKRHKRPLSVIMLDVDDFKGINDTQGHLCGDGVLESIGDTLRRTLRSSDVKSRYGGDEFLVILPETPAEGAEQVADHLQRAIERVEYAGRTRPFSLTVSVGVATVLPNETDALALVGRADAALYRDKSNRRNLRLVPSAGLTAESPVAPARS